MVILDAADEAPEDPGFHRIILHPQFDASLGEVKASYDSPYGTISSHWKVDRNTITWDVVVPPNTVGLVYLPGGLTITILGGNDIRQKCWNLAACQR
jgi:alpha-L-rhamnosidase